MNQFQQQNNGNPQFYQNQFAMANQGQVNNYEEVLEQIYTKRNFKYGAFFFDLPQFVTKEIIYQHLLKFFEPQSILQIVVPKDHQSGQSKKLAFIQLQNLVESIIFRKKINHTQIYGHPLKVGIIAPPKKITGNQKQNDYRDSEIFVLDIPSEIDYQTFDQIVSDSKYQQVLKVNMIDDTNSNKIKGDQSKSFRSCQIQFDNQDVAEDFKKAIESKEFQLGQRKSDQVWEAVKNDSLGDYVDGKVISLRCLLNAYSKQNILLQEYERALENEEVNDVEAEQKMVEEVQESLQEYFKDFKILSSLVKINPFFKQPSVTICFETEAETKRAMDLLAEEKNKKKQKKVVGEKQKKVLGEKKQEGEQQEEKEVLGEKKQEGEQQEDADLQIKALGFNFTCKIKPKKDLLKERELNRDGKYIFMKNLNKQVVDPETQKVVSLTEELLTRVLEKKTLANNKKLEVVSCKIRSSEHFPTTNYAIVVLSEGDLFQEVKQFAKENGSDLNKLFVKDSAFVNILHSKVFHKNHSQAKRKKHDQSTNPLNQNQNNFFRGLTPAQIYHQQAQFMAPPGMAFPPNFSFMPPANPLLQSMPPGMPFPQFQRPFVPFGMGSNLIYQQPPLQQPLGFRPQYQPQFNPSQSRINNNFNNNNFSNAPYNSNNNYNNQQANRNPIFQQRNTQSQAPQRFNNYNNNNNNNNHNNNSNNNSNNFQQPNQNRRPPQQNNTYPQQQNQASRPITQNNNFQNRNNNNLPQNNNNTNQQRRPNTQQTNIQPATRAQGVPVPLNRQPIQVNAVPLPINLPIRPGQPPVQQKPPQQQK